MITRGENFKQEILNICGSSTFGRYPKISIEKTYNMFLSDNWMVPYAGYIIGILNAEFANAKEGRGLITSIKLGRLVAVYDNTAYLININFNQMTQKVTDYQIVPIGVLQSSTGVVYIKENNKPQILFSDLSTLYLYDPTLTPSFQIPTLDGSLPIDFIPGYIDFHDTYFLVAATGTNTWRLSDQNNGLLFPDDAAHVGLLQTKPDNTLGVVRVPSRGNMIFVFGSIVMEPWFDVGYQLFPYQRNSSYNGDYGTLNAKTIAVIDELVVWLGINEKGGPTLMYSDGGTPKPITTDGFDYILANMIDPSDSQAFIYRQDGHIFYHINFYTDNISFYVDFLKDGTHKIYHACDENGNYFIASVVAFFNNQYYFLSRNNGNLYVFDTVFTTYNGAEIPRIRTCRNIRNIQQEAFIANDCGFTIESGNTNYVQQKAGPIYLITEDRFADRFQLITQNHYHLITQDGKRLVTQQADLCNTYCGRPKRLITEGSDIFFITQDGKYLLTQDGRNLISQQKDITDFNYLISQQEEIIYSPPRVDMSISIDGGEHFSSYDAQYLPTIGQRKNKLAWWQLGWSNDLVAQFRFVGLNRFVVTDGYVNIRQ
jgi:hypothetical protein